MVLVEGNPELPVVAGVAAPEVTKFLGPFREDTLNAAVYGRNNGAALKLADKSGWR
jgi:iron(III) transport system substrate-binding protein